MYLGDRSKKVQKEAGIDLGKYLHYAEVADCQDVINTTKIEGFLKRLADLGLGAWAKWPGG